MVLKIFYIAVICVIIIDMTDFMPTMKEWIWKMVSKKKYEYFRLKPFDCSLCLTFWTGLIFLTINKELSLLNLVLLLLIAISTPIVKLLIDLVLTALNIFLIRIIEYIENK